MCISRKEWQNLLTRTNRNQREVLVTHRLTTTVIIMTIISSPPALLSSSSSLNTGHLNTHPECKGKLTHHNMWLIHIQAWRLEAYEWKLITVQRQATYLTDILAHLLTLVRQLCYTARCWQSLDWSVTENDSNCIISLVILGSYMYITIHLHT